MNGVVLRIVYVRFVKFSVCPALMVAVYSLYIAQTCHRRISYGSPFHGKEMQFSQLLLILPHKVERTKRPISEETSGSVLC
jgi:hypothetical protein